MREVFLLAETDGQRVKRHLNLRRENGEATREVERMKRNGQRSRKSRVGRGPQQGSVGPTRSATVVPHPGGGGSMRVTVSVIKADIGAIGGHNIPNAEVLGLLRDRVQREHRQLLVHFY